MADSVLEKHVMWPSHLLASMAWCPAHRLGRLAPSALAHLLSISLSRSLSCSRLPWWSTMSRAPHYYGLASQGHLAPTSITTTASARTNLAAQSLFCTASSSCRSSGRRCHLLLWLSRCRLQLALLGLGTATTRAGQRPWPPPASSQIGFGRPPPSPTPFMPRERRRRRGDKK